MKFLWHLLLFTGLWMSLISGAFSQAKINLNKPTKLDADKTATPDSARAKVTNPKALTFTASTDQRFFFFNDTRNDNGRRIPVSIYGVRAGFLFPVKHPETVEPGGMRAAFKAGVGFYFVNQMIDRPGLLPGTSDAIERHLRIVTAYFEPYLYRKKSIEISLPLELGYGHSRYVEVDNQTSKSEVARGVFIPAGVGISGSYQFPSVRWFKPIHWFGLNLLTGYRFILKKDVPDSQVNYSGFYISVGPSFFLENLTADFGQWRKNRKKKKQAANVPGA